MRTKERDGHAEARSRARSKIKEYAYRLKQKQVARRTPWIGRQEGLPPTHKIKKNKKKKE